MAIAVQNSTSVSNGLRLWPGTNSIASIARFSCANDLHCSILITHQHQRSSLHQRPSLQRPHNQFQQRFSGPHVYFVVCDAPNGYHCAKHNLGSSAVSNTLNSRYSAHCKKEGERHCMNMLHRQAILGICRLPNRCVKTYPTMLRRSPSTRISYPRLPPHKHTSYGSATPAPVACSTARRHWPHHPNTA